jgi:AcrR family transcriptional regulator
MLDDIVKGAIRVLKEQGGRRFTTIRVAEEAGISVGSLYQYFPNKESILFQVQQQEWAETSGTLISMIEDRRYSPSVRLRRTVKAFFDSEWEETSLRKALAETGVNLDNTKQFIEMKSIVFSTMSDFIAEAVPAIPPGRRRFTAEFVFTTMSSLAEEVTNQARSRSEIKQWASHCATMLLLFLSKTPEPLQKESESTRIDAVMTPRDVSVRAHQPNHS